MDDLNGICRKQFEKELNEFPHFRAEVKDKDGDKMGLHFMALFSQKKDAVPLICLHGWPGRLSLILAR